MNPLLSIENAALNLKLDDPQPKDLLIADGLAPEIRSLVEDAHVPVQYLAGSDHPLAALTLALHGKAVDTLHLVAHGRAGAVQLGGHWITAEDLARNTSLLALWDVRTVALWSCEVGADRSFAQTLAELTGADVLATSDVLKGGRANARWQLDVAGIGRKGARAKGSDRCEASLNTVLPLSSERLAAWPHALNASINLAGLLSSSGTGYNDNTQSFVSANPQPAYTSITFSQVNTGNVFERSAGGNNIAGTLTYTVGGVTTSVAVTISRLIKTIDGSSQDTEAFYAVDSTGKAYLLVTDSFDGQNHMSYFPAGGTYNTSGDPPLGDLNAYLQASTDTTPPKPPASVDLVAASDTGTSSTDDLTQDTTPTLRVTFDQTGTDAQDTVAGDVVKLYDGSGNLLGSAILTAADITAGYVDITTATLAAGVVNFKATVTDLKGNTSPDSNVLPVTIDTTAPATAPTVTAQTTNDTTPAITGTATVAAGETLTVTVNGMTYTAGDGNLTLTGTNWSLQIPNAAALPAGTYSVTATVKDGAGNATSDATASELVIDTAVTAGPLDMTNATDSGTSAEDELTSNGLPVLTFTGEPGLTLTLRGPDGTALTQGTHYNVAYSGGTYTVTLLDAQPGGTANPFGTFTNGSATGNPAATADGTYTISATDTAGNTGAVGTFVIDTTRPATAPTVTAQTTNDTTPVITGTATVGNGEALTVTVNGVTYTAGDGNLTLTGTNWSLQIPNAQAIPSGTYPVTATVTDAAGNAISDATTSELTIDAALTVGPLDMTNATDSGSSPEDEVTSNGLPVLTFTGEPGLTLSLRGPDGTVLTAGTHYSVNYSGGTYTVTLLDAQPGGAPNPFGTYNSGYGLNGNPAATADGTYTINATDPAGNSGTVGTFVIDTTPPAAPTVNRLVTNNTQPLLSGTVTAGPDETVSVTVNGVTYTAADGLVVSGTTWSLRIPSSQALAAGTYAVTAVVTDPAGNSAVDATTSELVVDLGLTAGPLDMTNATDTGISPEDELTSNGLPVLTFPGEPGLVLSLKGPDGTTLNEGSHYTVSFTDGVYTVKQLDAQPGGAANPFGTFGTAGATGNPVATGDGTYTISARDPAGNTGTVGTFTIDTTPPAVVPTVTSQTTVDTTPIIVGTATLAAGETLSVTVNGVTYTSGDGNLTLNGTSWSLQIPDNNVLAAATYSVTARVTDAAGNAALDTTASELIVQQTVRRITPMDAAAGSADASDSTVTEGGTLRFAVELNAPSLAPSTMPLALGGSLSANEIGALRFTDGVTYDPVTGLITIPAGVSAFSIEVPTIDDALVEPVESVTLTLAGVAGTGTVVDNDQQSVTRVTAEDALNAGAPDGDSVVVEGQSLRYTVTLSAPSATPSRLSLAQGGTAAAADLGALSFSDGVSLDPATGELIIPAGVTSFTVTQPTIDDRTVEGTETATLTVGGVVGTGTIIDNDSLAVASVTAQDPRNPLSGTPDQAVEEGQSLEFLVALTGAGDVASTLPLSIGGTAAAFDLGRLTFSDGVTYNPITGLLTVPAGVSSFRITVPTVDDTQVELTESVVMNVGGVVGVGSITDNDRLAVARITPEDANNAANAAPDAVVEEGGTLRFAVALTGISPTPTTFPLGIAGTASGSDLGTLTFSDGVTFDPATGLVTVPAGVGSFTVSVPTRDDSTVEATESVRLSLGGLTATGLITDNDSPSIARITAEDAAQAGQAQPDPAVVEGQTLRFSVALTQPTARAVTFPLGLSGSAAAQDLGALSFSNGVTFDAATGLITVPAGVGSFNVLVATVDDRVVETTENVRLNIGGVTAQGIITDNDQPSVTQIVAEDGGNLNAPNPDVAVVEGQTLRFSVQLSAAGTREFSLPLSVTGTAVGADLGAIGFTDGVRLDAATGLLVIPAGVASFAVLLPTMDDRLVETAESAILNIGGVAAVGTITDNDAPAVARVVAEDAANAGANSPDNAVVEGQNLRFTVALTEPTVRETRLPFSWSGTATAADIGSFILSDGVKWDATTGELVVPAGVGAFAVIVPTVDDPKVEGTETLQLAVGGVSGTGTILDNDSLSVVSAFARDPLAAAETAADPAVVEGQSLQFNVVLNQAPSAPSTIPFSWSGTVSGADLGSLSFSDGVTYDPRTGLLTIPAGISKFTIGVATVDDQQVEASERVSLNIGGLIASGTILDNDRPSIRSIQATDAATPATPSLGVMQDTTVEEGQPLRYVVTLDTPTSTAITFPLGVSGTAVAADHGSFSFSNGVTFDSSTGLITVPAGITTFEVLVPTVDDVRSEATESLILTIDGLHVAGRITDNDRPMILNAKADPGAATALIRIPENNTPVTVMSTPEPVTWVVSGGADAGMFAVTNDGRLSFQKAPDYETPADQTKRNTYSIELTATDVNGNASRQMITVEVTDVIEAVPLYGIRSQSGDRQLSTNLGLSQDRAKSQGSTVDIDFYVMPSQTPGTVPLKAWTNILTGDIFYAPEGATMPYACYVASDSSQLGFVRPAGQSGIAVHLFLNDQGITQAGTQSIAQKMGWLTQGYRDLGPLFSAIDPNVPPTGQDLSGDQTSVTPMDPVSLVGTTAPVGP